MAITYATLNPADKSANITLSNGNLTATHNTSVTWDAVRSTISKSSGKWYWEIKIDTVDANSPILGIGLSTATLTNFTGADANAWGYWGSNGTKLNNSTQTAYGATFTTNDIIGVALDMDGGSVTMYKNGVSQGTMFTGLSGSMFAMPSLYYGTVPHAVTCNFGATAFTYTPPAGYNAGLYTGTADTTGAYLLMALM